MGEKYTRFRRRLFSEEEAPPAVAARPLLTAIELIALQRAMFEVDNSTASLRSILESLTLDDLERRSAELDEQIRQTQAHIAYLRTLIERNN